MCVYIYIHTHSEHIMAIKFKFNATLRKLKTYTLVGSNALVYLPKRKVVLLLLFVMGSSGTDLTHKIMAAYAFFGFFSIETYNRF